MYKIMIIEDNEKIRSELGEFLSKNGYEVSMPDDFGNILSVSAALMLLLKRWCSYAETDSA